jgi:hypothetical protein
VDPAALLDLLPEVLLVVMDFAAALCGLLAAVCVVGTRFIRPALPGRTVVVLAAALASCADCGLCAFACCSNQAEKCGNCCFSVDDSPCCSPACVVVYMCTLGYLSLIALSQAL